MDAARGSTAAGRIVLTGRLWKRWPYLPADPEPLQTAQMAQERDCLLLDIDVRETNTEAYKQVLRAAKRPAGEQQQQQQEEEEEPGNASLSEDDVLFDAAIVARSESFPEVEIANLPVRHVILRKGQIASPLVARAVRRHLVTLGLDWGDAAAHLPQLLADLSASAPLRHVVLVEGSRGPTEGEVKPVIDALVCSPRVVGVYLSFATHSFLRSVVLGGGFAARLCRSKQYLAFHALFRSNVLAKYILARDSLCEVFSGASEVKQLRLSVSLYSPEALSKELKPPASNCSLTRVRLDFGTELLPLLKMLSSLKSLTDVGLFISSPEEMQVLLSSELHTRILTLRLYLERPSQQINELILQGLMASTCTIQFLYCDFLPTSINPPIITEVLLNMFELLAGSEPPVRLTTLRLRSDNAMVGSELIAGLCKYLCDPAARNLVHLDLQLLPNRRTDIQTAAEWELARSLRNNFTLCSLGFKWKNNAPESFAVWQLRRNKLYRATQLFVEEPVKPDLAKLFLCGHPGVGKTTLSRVLLSFQHACHGQIPLALRHCFPRLEQDPDRTRGMEMHPLKFRGLDNKLMIHDLAGQEEYHVFHHYFMNATSNDIFIVVCKHDRSRDSEFKKQLEYWLRFIASHKSIRTKKGLNDQSANEIEMKPKVIVVVNFFQPNTGEETMMEITSSWTSSLIQRFSSVLDFDENPRAKSIFGVNAKTGIRVQQVYKRLRSLLENFGNTAWPVPKLCYDIYALITKRQARKNWLNISCLAAGTGKPRLLTTFSTVYEAINDNATIEPIKIQAALEELHAEGYVIYFPLEDTSDNHGNSISRTRILSTEGSTMSTLVIIDTNWFSNKLIGSLLGTYIGDARSGHSEWSKEDIKNLLREQGCHERDLEEILRYLLKLELCVELGSTPTGEEDSLLFPALLKDKEIVFPNNSMERSTKFFGRRRKCRDRSAHLIPFAVFTRLQVKLYKTYSANNRSFHHGYGWISFMRGRVGVVVRFGGNVSNEAWESKQWFDILTFCPADSSLESFESSRTRPMDDPRFLDAEKLINEIRNHFDAACDGGGLGGIPTVGMEEMVLQNAEESSDASPLAYILDKVKTEGLLDSHQEWVSLESTARINLLLPAEIRDCVEGRLETLQSIEEEFCGFCSEEDDGINTEQLEHNAGTGASNDAIFEGPLTGDSLMMERKLNRLHEEIRGTHEDVRGLHSKVEKIDKSLQTIKEDIRKLRNILREEAEEIIANCSTRLLRHELRKDRAYPLYPYLVNVEGKLAVLGMKKVRIHFLCEARGAGQVPHPVEGQKGREVTVEWAPWMIKAARVMVPALRMLCCLARVAAAVHLPSALPAIPTGEGLDTLLSGLGISHGALEKVIWNNAIQALLQGVPDADWKELKNCRPAEGEVQEVVAAILGRSVEEDVDMESDFGLRRVISEQEGRFYWVCRDHGRGMKPASPVPNPYKAD